MSTANRPISLDIEFKRGEIFKDLHVVPNPIPICTYIPICTNNVNDLIHSVPHKNVLYDAEKSSTIA